MIRRNNKYIFETTRGDDFSLHIFIDKLPISNARTLTSTIRRNEDAQEKVSTSTSVSGKGNYTIKFSDSQMSKLDGTYVIDLQLTGGTGFGSTKTLLIGSLIVNKDVTY